MLEPSARGRDAGDSARRSDAARAGFSRIEPLLFLIGQHDRALEAGERALTIAKSLADTHA